MATLTSISSSITVHKNNRTSNPTKRSTSEPLEENNGIPQTPSSFGDYMELKRQKLLKQVHEEVVPKTLIFAGISVYVNGYTDPPAVRLREMIVANGGNYHHYYRPGKNTYMVASAIASTKWKTLNKSAVVRPEWIVESVKAGKRLPVDHFLLFRSRPETVIWKDTNAEGKLIRGRQLTIHDFTNPRRRNQLMMQKYQEDQRRKEQEKLEEKKPREEAIVRIRKQPLHKNRSIPLEFDYGHGEEAGTLFIGKVNINYTKEVEKSALHQLEATYEAKLADLDLQPIIFSIRFLERIFSTEPDVNPEWLLIISKLKRWLNVECKKQFDALLYPRSYGRIENQENTSLTSENLMISHIPLSHSC